tara:strand:- start:134 stop:931 length:798 start_codon:yes stop_codon:yes gene_type:complete
MKERNEILFLLKPYYIFLCIISISLTSCFVQDDSDEICIENCTEFKGQIKTVDNKSVAGLTIFLEFIETNIFLSSVRRIATATTDKNGFYNIAASLKDYEIDNGGIGQLELNFNIADVNNIVSDAYLKPELQTDVGLKYLNQSYVKFYNLNKRDTILTNNFIVPKKGNLSVKLKNFSPILEDDYFSVNVRYSYSFFSDHWNSYTPSKKGQKMALEGVQETIFNIETILNGNVIVLIIKKKNGIREEIKEVVNLTSTDIYNLKFDY